MDSKFYIGIDLGKSGGLSCIQDGNIVYQEQMPKTERDIVTELHCLVMTIMSKAPNANITIAMEKISPHPGEGVVSVATFANHCGGISYTCTCLHMMYRKHVNEVVRIAPTTWKKHFGLLDSKISKYDKKKLSVDYVNKRFGQSLTYSRNGISDAILIALYLYEKEGEIQHAV